MGLRNKDLISIHDLSVGEVATILDVAKKLKRKRKKEESRTDIWKAKLWP